MNNENGNFFVGPRYEYDNKTGLSHFILSTVEKNTTKVLQLHGLLSELPEITFNINYEDGPGNEWQDVGGVFQVDLTFVVYWAVLLLLSYIFRYGEQLQQLSDETL